MRTKKDNLFSKINSSISAKFILFTISLIVSVITIILLYQSSLVKHELESSMSDKIQRVGKLVSSGSRESMLNYDFSVIDGFAEEIRKDIDVADVAFTNNEGKKVNSELSADYKSTAEKEFGKEKILASDIREYQFPIVSNGISSGMLTIKVHSLNNEQRNSALQYSIILLYIAAVIFLVVIIWYISNKLVIHPLKKISKVVDKLSVGDVTVEIDSEKVDEIGELEHSLHLMIENTKEQAAVMERIARGEKGIEIKTRSEKDVLALNMRKVITTLVDLVTEANALGRAAVEGKLSTKGNAEKFEGGYRDIISGLNNIMIAISKPMEEMGEVLAKLSKGDLTARMTGQYHGDYSKITANINKLTDSFNLAITEVKAAVEATVSASNRISSSSEQMAAGAREQSVKATEIASSSEEMTKTILETSHNSNKSAEAAMNACSVAKEGGKVVQQTIEEMNRIAEVVKKSALTVHTLGKGSDKIGEIVQVIDDIADQTNLLALNAAIEAARAGEQGRGFAVVADEVRKLAERTTKATKEIASMIKQIQTDTEGAVQSMSEGTQEVEKGIVLADMASRSLEKIVLSVEQVLDLSNQLAAASEEQSTVSEQISKDIEAISSVTQETAIGIQDMASAAEDLNSLTENLQELTSRFKIEASFSTQGSGSNKLPAQSRR